MPAEMANVNASHLPRKSIVRGLTPGGFNASNRLMAANYSQGFAAPIGKDVVFENSYKMMPDKGTKFSAVKVRSALEEVLEIMLENKTYQACVCSNIIQCLSDKIRTSLKQLGFPRYKFVVNVILSGKRYQGISIASRATWDMKLDDEVSATHEGPDFILTAIVYGCYFE